MLNSPLTPTDDLAKIDTLAGQIINRNSNIIPADD